MQQGARSGPLMLLQQVGVHPESSLQPGLATRGVLAILACAGECGHCTMATSVPESLCLKAGWGDILVLCHQRQMYLIHLREDGIQLRAVWRARHIHGPQKPPEGSQWPILFELLSRDLTYLVAPTWAPRGRHLEFRL